MKEEIRPYPRLPIYEVSNLGRVRRIGGKWRALHANKNRIPYYGVTLYSGGKKIRVEVRRLVAITFLGEPPTPRHEVAHWDGDSLNNVVTNLRWATRKENCADTARLGRTYRARNEKSVRCKLTSDEVREIRKRRARGESNLSLARAFNTSPQYIGHIVHGRRRQYA